MKKWKSSVIVYQSQPSNQSRHAPCVEIMNFVTKTDDVSFLLCHIRRADSF